MNRNLSPKLLQVFYQETLLELLKFRQHLDPQGLDWQSFLHTLKGNLVGEVQDFFSENYHNLKKATENNNLELLNNFILDFELSIMKRKVGELEQTITLEEIIPVLKFHTQELGEKCGKKLFPLTVGIPHNLKHALLPKQLWPHLIQLIQNSLDHGIECPAMRSISKKPAQGRIAIHARQHNQMIELIFQDDGQGSTLSEKFLSQAKNSTANGNSFFSGQGLGIYALKHVLEQLGGELKITSIPAEHFTVSLFFPLTFNAQMAKESA